MQALEQRGASESAPGGAPFGIVLIVGFLLWAFGLIGCSPARGDDFGATSCRIGVATTTRHCDGYAVATDWGSGTLIDRDLVLTCWHTFRDSQSRSRTITIYHAGESVAGKLIAYDKRADLALVRIPPVLYVEPCRVAFGRFIAGGCSFLCCGYGDGEYREVGGPLNRVTQLANGRQSLELDCRTRDGDSGGGCFDSRGRLVGVVWGWNGYAYVTTGEPLAAFLHKHLGPRYAAVVK